MLTNTQKGSQFKSPEELDEYVAQLNQQKNNLADEGNYKEAEKIKTKIIKAKDRIHRK